MKSIIKTLLFGMFLLVAVGVKAQEASGGYEYAEIFINNQNMNLVAVYSDRESESLGKGSMNVKDAHEAVLKEVGKKIKDGWAVFNVGSTGAGFPIYYLRKKK